MAVEKAEAVDGQDETQKYGISATTIPGLPPTTAGYQQQLNESTDHTTSNLSDTPGPSNTITNQTDQSLVHSVSTADSTLKEPLNSADNDSCTVEEKEVDGFVTKTPDSKDNESRNISIVIRICSRKTGMAREKIEVQKIGSQYSFK